VSLLKKLFNIGARHEDPSKSHILIIQNSFAIVSTLFAIPFEVYFISINQYAITGVFFAIQIVLCSSLYLNHIGKLNASRYFTVFIYALALPLLTYYIGFQSGFYLYYFLAPILMLSIFDLSEKKQLALTFGAVLISISATLAIGQFQIKPIVPFELPTLSALFRSNFVIGLILLVVMNFQIINRYFITNRQLKKSNAELEKNITEKNVLLAEVHHRVKNNLAVMTSLTNLQIHQTKNKEASEILVQNSDRLKSMSLIHDSLYNSGNLNEINFNHYLANLCEDVITSYKQDDFDLKLIMDTEDVTVDITTAVPLGLVANEIIVNSLKHAFLTKTSGTITIQLSESNEKIKLCCSDNGNGFDTSLSSNSIGIMLINDLADQIDANLKVNSSNDSGTSYELVFHHSPK
jgi:two-component sensor histidine kinase